MRTANSLLSLVLLRALALVAVTFLAEPASAQCDLRPLSTSNSAPFDRFGQAIVIDGDRGFVGLPGYAANAGAVLLFERVGGDWVEVQTISGSAANGNFGTAIAVEGDHLLVGAPTEATATNGLGAAYLFQLGAGGGQLHRFEGNSSLTESFGGAVSLNAGYALIGAPSDHTVGFMAGAAYLFEEQSGGWSQQAKFTGVSTFGYESFGAALAIRADLVVVSQPIEFGSGTIFVFQRGVNGWTNTPVQMMSSPCPGIEFGTPLLFDGHELIACSPDGSTGGCINFMHWDGNQFVLDEIIDLPGSGFGLGRSIARLGDRLLVGSGGVPAGRAHLFLRSGGSWQRTHIFHPVDTGPATVFGYSVALHEDEGWIGDPVFEPNSTGRIDRFQLDRGVRHCASLPNSTGSAALIRATGCASIGDNDLVLRAAPTPSQPGLFAYSLDRNQQPFGNGFLCLTGAIQRLPVIAASASELRFELDIGAPPSVAGQITETSTWHFQAWFRDPLAAGSGWNSSDAISVTFGP